MKLIKKLFLFVIIVVFIILVYVILNGYIYYKETIDEKSISDRVSELQNKETFVHYGELPTYYIDAVVSIEDHRFYDHSGVDFISVVRAIYDNFKAKELVEGGSSISQQVAKNLCFSQQKKMYRKIAELFVVNHLENDYSKNEILELYVNNIYYGNGYYNIYDASMRIF